MKFDFHTFKTGLKGLCPKCEKASIFKPGLTLDLKQQCDQCGLDLSKNDSADGPAVFLIFVLGFSVVPLALVIDMFYPWPVWVHAAVWGTLSLVLTIGSLRPLKAYIIALQYKYRKRDWDDETRA